MQDEKAISYRLSPQQELVWAMSPDGPTDAGQLVLGLEGPADIDRLRAAFSQLVERHEVAIDLRQVAGLDHSVKILTL